MVGLIVHLSRPVGDAERVSLLAVLNKVVPRQQKERLAAYGVGLEVSGTKLICNRNWHKSMYELELQHRTLDSNAWSLLFLHLKILPDVPDLLLFETFVASDRTALWLILQYVTYRRIYIVVFQYLFAIGNSQLHLSPPLLQQTQAYSDSWADKEPCNQIK